MDDRACYEGFARDNGFRCVQNKGIVGHSSETGETINEANGLISEFETWFAGLRGISS